jgi:pyridoxamine 5'-phosphate oxidase-like protein
MSARGRTKAQRREDTLALLEGRNQLWICTVAQQPYMVPMSYAWDGHRITIATNTDTPTAQHLFETGVARLAIGETFDVVMIDARVETAVDVHAAPSDLADAYAAHSDWDPRTGTAVPATFFVLAPSEIYAWREAFERPQRTLMRAGDWLPATLPASRPQV